MSAKHVAILERARGLIANETFTSVCNAIDDCGPKDKVPHEINEWIVRSLEGCLSVKWWLLKSGFVLNADQMREYRLAWIDQMIPIVREWK